MRSCKVAGCNRPAIHSRSPYCPAHKARSRRHGHPNQRAITKADLAPYQRQVKEWIDSRENADTLRLRLQERWSAVVSKAEETERLWNAGSPMNSYERDAYLELLKVARDVDAQAIAEAMVGMGLMQELSPRSFMDDASYRTQLSRRYRGLTDLNAGTWYDHAEGRTKKAYKELSPKAAQQLGQILAVVFNPIASMINRKINETVSQEEATKRALFAALEEA